jgi:Fe-S cluster assembly protein SufD
LPSAVRVESLATALETDAGRELVRLHLARQARWRDSAFAALNTAFLADGVFVHVPAHVSLDRPLELLFLSTGHATSDGPVVTHPRSLIVLEKGAQAAIVETYAGIADGVYWTNAVTEVVTGEGARAEVYRVQREGSKSFQVATTHSRQERDSYLGLHVMTLGAALARHDIVTVLDGPGAELILNGLYLLSGAQHADHHTLIDHAQPHCASHEFFNGVLAERAHGVFTGRIVVRPGAQRTDSKQTNNNLLLSTEARADSQPQLEIHADDVKCTHGSTVGPIDETQLHYLRSRGLSPEAARGMLTYGFGAEVLGRMRHPDVRNRLDRLVRERLS